MKSLKELLVEGPVRSLRNSLLGAKFFADSAEMHLKQGIATLNIFLQDPKANPAAVEEAMSHMKEGIKELRKLKRHFRSKNM